MIKRERVAVKRCACFFRKYVGGTLGDVKPLNY